jgi:predicted dehydrogenase
VIDATPGTIAGTAVPARGHSPRRRPRVGALGTGWIGRHRLEVLAAADVADIVGIADPSAAAMDATRAIAPDATACETLEDLLEQGLDGLIVATPTAQHAVQSAVALQAGVAVCCQKPLARTAAEAEAVITTARRANALLMVDFSYRYTEAAQALRQQISAGALGTLVGAELTFHNAYGPDKAWYRNRELAGGGCVTDLGVHLIDLLTWLTGATVVEVPASALYTAGRVWAGAEAVEDFAQCQLRLDGGATATLTCSWWLAAGCDALIDVTLYGTAGGLRLRNVGGSFYDFRADRLTGTQQETLTDRPDAWGGRAVVDWARRLAEGGAYDPACESHIAVSRALDAIYTAAAARP